MYSKDAEGWIAPVAFNFTVVNEIGHWVVPISWAQESNELDCSFVWPAFDKDPTQDLSLDYYQNAFPLVDRAISKAGYRMAAVMNKALENC